jgi:hypothetical protein
MTGTVTPPVCDDCTKGLPAIGQMQMHYGFCSICGIKRACYGTDPDPLSPRASRKRQTPP